MKNNFTTLQLFSLVDGRLSTEIGDVYLMLNHICDDNLMTHHLPVAMDYLKTKNPAWLIEQNKKLSSIKEIVGTDDFETLIASIKKRFNEVVEIPQLKDEFDTSDFVNYMIDNSLLIKRLSA